jgi:outer membrane protein OmpA-like peptidoglycan-associated protein
MFKKVLILTSILTLAACSSNFTKRHKASHNEKDNKVTFDFQNQSLPKEGKKILDEEVVKAKNNSSLKLEVKTSCDKSRSGSKKYNVSIANKRNIIIKDYLVKNGVHASRLSLVNDGVDKGSEKNFKSKNTCTVTVAKK